VGREGGSGSKKSWGGKGPSLTQEVGAKQPRGQGKGRKVLQKKKLSRWFWEKKTKEDAEGFGKEKKKFGTKRRRSHSPSLAVKEVSVTAAKGEGGGRGTGRGKRRSLFDSRRKKTILSQGVHFLERGERKKKKQLMAKRGTS